jgi:hypothetical protein
MFYTLPLRGFNFYNKEHTMADANQPVAGGSGAKTSSSTQRLKMRLLN